MDESFLHAWGLLDHLTHSEFQPSHPGWNLHNRNRIYVLYLLQSNKINYRSPVRLQKLQIITVIFKHIHL
jgi:hypothetical protein